MSLDLLVELDFRPIAARLTKLVKDAEAKIAAQQAAASGANLTGNNALADVIVGAGFKGDHAIIAYAIAKAESGGNAHSLNDNPGTGDLSYGLFQINMIGSLGPARLRQFHLHAYSDLFNPQINARVAFQMSNGGKNWNPWSTWKNGAYKRFLAEARAAFSGVSGGHPASGLPGFGGYGYGDPNPYTGGPHIGVDVEVGMNTQLWLPSAHSVAAWGINGAIGHYLLLHEGGRGRYIWLGHLNKLVHSHPPPGTKIGLTGSPETSGGFGSGAHLYLAVTHGTSLSWGASENPINWYNHYGHELFHGGGTAPGGGGIVRPTAAIPTKVVAV